MPRIAVSIAAFTAYTVFVAVNHGLLGFLADHARGGWSLQVLVDLAVAAACIWVVAVPDPRTRGIRVWPHVALTPFLGSIALLGCLVVHDWGGIIGLTLPMESPERYRGLLVMNTMLATAEQPLPLVVLLVHVHQASALASIAATPGSPAFCKKTRSDLRKRSMRECRPWRFQASSSVSTRSDSIRRGSTLKVTGPYREPYLRIRSGVSHQFEDGARAVAERRPQWWTVAGCVG